MLSSRITGVLLLLNFRFGYCCPFVNSARAAPSPMQRSLDETDSHFRLRFPVPSHWAYTSGMAAAFDTLSAAKELQAAGFEQTQAEAVARILRDGQGDLATKDDIAALRTELGAIKWVLGLVAALNIAILVRLLLV